MQDDLGQDDWRKLIQREERSELFWFLLICVTCGTFLGIFLVYFK